MMITKYLPSGKKQKQIDDTVEMDGLLVTLTISNNEKIGKTILGTPHYDESDTVIF